MRLEYGNEIQYLPKIALPYSSFSFDSNNKLYFQSITLNNKYRSELINHRRIFLSDKYFCYQGEFSKSEHI